MVLGFTVHCSVTCYGHETKLGQTVLSSTAFRADCGALILCFQE